MRSFAPGSGFVAAMQDIATWGEVTLIIHTDDGIFEITELVGGGEVGRGYYNISEFAQGHARSSAARALRGHRLRRTAVHGQVVGLSSRF